MYLPVSRIGCPPVFGVRVMSYAPRSNAQLSPANWVSSTSRANSALKAASMPADQACEGARLGDQEEPRQLGAHDERVRDVARPEDERAGWCDMGLAVNPDRELTFKDVEPFVLVVVDVERRAASPRGGLLGDH